MEPYRQAFYIITGGTMVHVAPHFSFCAPAYGAVGQIIKARLQHRLNEVYGHPEDAPDVVLIRTEMARAGTKRTAEELEAFEACGISRLETNEDLDQLIDGLVADDETRCIVMSAAVCDWEPTDVTRMSNTWGNSICKFGKHVDRLSTRAPFPGASPDLYIGARPSLKILKRIREYRKDVFLVGFKATAGVTKQETYRQGLRLLKENSCNLVFANDVHNHHNMVITPEEFPYHGKDRKDSIGTLCDMIATRTRLDFVRTVMVDDAVADPQRLHDDGAIPQNFVPVLKSLIEAGAYKPFLNRTSGHFGCKTLKSDYIYERITSARKVNHNDVFTEGMARVFPSNDNTIRAGGTSKPSVGEHTQRLIYEKLGDSVHSIVHFHCPRKPAGEHTVSSASQKEFECGSVQCGTNTAGNMLEVDPGVWAVHLEGHGPNIAFHRNVSAQRVIELIDQFWDLSKKTGGPVE